MADLQQVRRETEQLALQQAIASGTWAIPAGWVVLALMASRLGAARALACAAVLAAYLLGRNRWLRVAQERVRQGSPPGQALLVSTVGLGLLLGGFALLAFGVLPYEGQLLLTLLLCCWCAAAMLSSGLHAVLYGGYLAAVLGQLALAWLRHGDAIGHLMAMALAFYAVVLYAFSLNFSRRVAEGIAIRAENAQLVRQLAAANEAKTRFLMAASHDLRQPLHALGLMGAGLLRLSDPAETRSLALTLAATVQNLNRLFSSVLDISRLDSGDVRIQLADVSLDALAAQLDAEYRALCLAEDRRWECQVEAVAVRSDPAQLERLLRNLLDNALKHGGRGAIRLSVARDGDEALVTVADTGPGIAPAERERVFDEFYRSGSSGLGLGLSIVRRLADRLGAQLDLGWTDPQRQRGACIRLRLPALPPGVPLPPIAEAAVDLTGLAVLVLDDDPTILQACAALLGSWGCRVATCTGPQDLPGAVAQLGEPDVALVDCHLGGGVDGVEVIAATQQAHPGMGTLIITGESDPKRLAVLGDLGFVLPKPLSPEALHRALAGVRSAEG